MYSINKLHVYSSLKCVIGDFGADWSLRFYNC